MTDGTPARNFFPLADARRAMPVLVTLLLSITVVAASVSSGGHNEQRWLQAGFLVLASLMMVGGDRLALPWTPAVSISRAMLALAALGVVSSLSAFSPLHGLQELSTLALLLMVALCAGREMAPRYQASLLLVLRIIAIGCALYCVQIIIVWVASIALRTQPDLYTFSPGFSSYRFANHAQTVVLPLLALLCCMASASHRRGYLLLAACGWGLLFVLGGRGTLVGLVSGMLLTLYLRRAHARPLCLAMMTGALGGLVLYLVLFNWVPLALGMEPFSMPASVIERSVADPTSSRIALWAASLELIAAHPALGIGPLHYAHELKDTIRFGHPHNWVLQVAAEWGLPALLLVVFVVLRGMCGLIRSAARLDAADQPNQLAACAWIMTGAAILVDGLVSGLVVMPVSQMLIALYVACATGWYWSLQTAPVQRAAPGMRLLAAALVVGAAVVMVTSIVRKPPTSGAPIGAIHFPRYWINGNF
jgi:putative inorganic carbon (hco3(-)) transporter